MHDMTQTNSTNKATLLPTLHEAEPPQAPISEGLALSPMWLFVGAFAFSGFVLSLL